jgi:hypothetical protein
MRRLHEVLVAEGPGPQLGMLPASRPRLRRALLPHADRHAAPGSGDVTVGEAQFGLREVAGQRGVRPSAAFLFLPVAPDVEASPDAPSPSGSARDDAPGDEQRGGDVRGGDADVHGVALGFVR